MLRNCKARVTFRVFKFGRCVIVYVGRVRHVSLNVRTRVKKEKRRELRSYYSCFESCSSKSGSSESSTDMVWRR